MKVKSAETTMQDRRLPEFTTQRLFLRGIRLSDADSYEKHFADYEVLQYLNSSIPWPYPRGGAKEYFTNVMFPGQGIDSWNWGIFFKEYRRECIGCISLWRESRPENRGFWLARKYWGQGLMTEAVQPILNYAFKELGFKKLVFANAVQNKASRRIKEKTGCRYVGTEPRQFLNLEFTECEIWELAKEDWLRFYKGKK